MTNGTFNQTAEVSTDYKEEIDQMAFAKRLAAVRDMRNIRSVRAFALQTGVSITAMRGYLSGAHDPTREALIRIAMSFEVGLEWLATGRGSMASDAVPPANSLPLMSDSSASSEVDAARLTQAYLHASKAFKDRGVADPDAAHLMLVVAGVYEHLGDPVDRQQLAALAQVLSAPWVPRHRAGIEKLHRDLEQKDEGPK